MIHAFILASRSIFSIFSNFLILPKLHNSNFKLCCKQYNKTDLSHLVVVSQLSGGWRHNYSIKIKQAG
jgi:hypothetical protein